MPTLSPPVGFQDSRAITGQDANTRTATEAIKIAVVEDDERMLQALIFQLGTAGFQVAAYASAEQFFKASATKEFDCVVADICLARMSGLQLQEELSRRASNASIVFITGRGNLSIGVQAMRAGAVDVLEKPLDDKVLLTAIKRGVQRSRAGRAERAERLDIERRFSSLPVRQREVFTLITAGLLNKQVAAELGISERTVKVHRERLRRKMGADSPAELARMAGVLQIHLPRAPSASPK
ncbi:MAG: response regulator [Candidatus Binataceae bacterium]|jgi:RNA polymerase sigma factor (sigma-70 family)